MGKIVGFLFRKGPRYLLQKHLVHWWYYLRRYVKKTIRQNETNACILIITDQKVSELHEIGICPSACQQVFDYAADDRIVLEMNQQSSTACNVHMSTYLVLSDV